MTDRNDNDLLRAARKADALDLATFAAWMVLLILGAMIGTGFFGNQF